MRLQGKAGIVVGGGQTPGEMVGNGRAAALLFAREGAKVLVVDQNLSSAEETTAIIASEGGTAEAFQADWTIAADCERYAQACRERWGKIDFLQNSVATFTGDSRLEDLDETAYRRIMDVNLTGLVFSCRAVLRIMQAQRSGTIVNISSVGVYISSGSYAVAYQLSKSGLNTLTRILARDNAPFGIRVNALTLGSMDTPMVVEGRGLEGADKERFRVERAKNVPLGRGGTGWDTANASLFLHSEESSFITGVNIPVDGGLLTKVG